MFRRKQFDVTVFKEKIGIWEKKNIKFNVPP